MIAVGRNPRAISAILALAAFLSLLLYLVLGPGLVGSQTTFTVTKPADTNDGVCDSDCSLREAIIAANALAGADTITLPAGTYTLTIAGASEDPRPPATWTSPTT